MKVLYSVPMKKLSFLLAILSTAANSQNTISNNPATCQNEECRSLNSEFSPQEIQSLKNRRQEKLEQTNSKDQDQKFQEAEKTIERGEIGLVRYIAGGTTATLIGLGTGHAIEKNWV